MKKALLSVLAVAMVFVGCKKDPVLVGSITLSQSVASVIEGDQLKITATVAPDNAENKELAWSSDNTGVATVDASGTITGVSAGSAKITAAATDASGVKATCEVTVTKKVILVTKIDLSYTEYALKKGETVTLQAQITPADATYQTVSFTSSDPNVASVDDKGVVTAKAKGTANITAKATDESGVSSAACVITVTEPKPLFVKFKQAVMRVGGKAMTQQAWYGTADKFSERDDADNLTWSASGNAVTVDGAKFTAAAAGETVGKAIDADGNEVSFNIKVLAPTQKPADYFHGVQLVDCSKADGWKTKPSTFTLGPGYVEGTQRITNEGMNGYKIAEVNFYDKPCDASKINNPALYLRIFISDVKQLTLDGAGEIELRSNMNSAYDESEEICWPWSYFCADAENANPNNAKLRLKNGWNNIVLPFALSHQGQTTSNLGGFRPGKINYLRIFQNPNAATAPNVKIVIDQARIVDWTEFDNCDNFDMWYDRMTDNNMFLCQLDENDKKEGKGSFAVVDHIISGPVSNYRLEMWDGLEYALPADMDMSNSQLKFWLYVSDGAAFKDMWTVVETCSEKTADANGYSWSVPNGGIDFKTGWNEITLDFAAAGGDTSATSKRDLRKLLYFRVVFTPMGSNAVAKPYTYKIDDIRIVKK